MHSPIGVEAEVLWWREGDAWVGVLGRRDDVSPEAAWTGRAGFAVERVASGDDAYARLSSGEVAYDLLVTDVLMPGMDEPGARWIMADARAGQILMVREVGPWSPAS